MLFIVMFLALGSGSLFAQWNIVTGGVRNNTNIEVGGNARIEGTLLLPKTEIIYYINTFKVPMPPNNSCSSIVVTTPSNNFVFPSTPCTDPPSTVPVYGTVNASINNNMLNGLVIQHTNGKEITVTPDGSIRFWNGQTIGPSGTSTIIGLNSPWVLDGTNMRFSSGNVWIGTRRPNTTSIHKDYRLSVDGKIVAQSIFLLGSADLAWADDVFEENYILIPLSETEKYIIKNKHLPGIPSEYEVKQNGIDIAKMDAQLLRKLEELYLHVIKLEKNNLQLKREIDKLKK